MSSSLSPGFPHREQVAEPSPFPGEDRVLSAEVGRHLFSESYWAEGTRGREQERGNLSLFSCIALALTVNSDLDLSWAHHHGLP